MSFGLKNVEATNQRVMIAIFHDLIHKTLEDYVDDILLKSHNVIDHLFDLETMFDRLVKNHLMLNPKKCVFGITYGKLLRFIVSWCCIEINSQKVKAILDMPPPKTLKQLHTLQGKLQSI